MSAAAVVMGLGVTGMSCVRHLHARGYAVTVMDTRPRPPLLAPCRASFPDVPVRLGPWQASALLQAQLVAVSPGIPRHEPVLDAARESGVDVAGDVELFARTEPGTVVAITGTNGKSTVTTLVGAILSGCGRDIAVGGNLGTPALDLLAAQPADGYVLELSSFQLEWAQSLSAEVACILNISADHLDRYPDLDSYVAAKQRIYRHARVAVYNADDARTTPSADFAGERLAVSADLASCPARWGLAGEAGELWLVADGERLAPASSLKLAGRHNAFNAVAALAVAAALGVPPASAWPWVRDFPGLPHRCVEVARYGGVRFVDDSKATNVGAAVAAVEGLDDGSRRLLVIAGGEGKGADFGLLRPAFARHVREVVLIGRDAPLLRAALDGACALHDAADMEAAVRRAVALAKPGDTVVLAPACASFDMFASYIERGEAFAAAVQRLAAPGVVS